jgi:hypothetical protein
MSQPAPILTFRVSVPSKASPEAVYDVLSDLRTHLDWAGERAPDKNFRLLTMDAPSSPVTVGDRFSSSGANVNGTFHDRSTVVHAERGTRFDFDTESTLERKHGKTWHARFGHRYALERSGAGAVVSYTCEVRPQNYVPYWLQPGMRAATRVMVQRAMRKNLANLAQMAEADRGWHTVRPAPTEMMGRAASGGAWSAGGEDDQPADRRAPVRVTPDGADPPGPRLRQAGDLLAHPPRHPRNPAASQVATYPVDGVRYWWTRRMATEPSPTAPATCLIDPWRTSPAANTPGRLVSSSIGGRSSGQPAGGWPSWSSSVPVTTNPHRSRWMASGSQPVRGSAPMRMNSAVAGTVSVAPEVRSLRVRPESRRSPCPSTASVW